MLRGMNVITPITYRASLKGTEREWILCLKTWERNEERLLGGSCGFDGKIWRLTTFVTETLQC